MGKRPRPPSPPGAYMPTSDLRGSGPSDPSRDSVSEASKAIEGRRTGEDLAEWRQRRYGKEGRGDAPRLVRVQSTTSRQSEALESTAPSVLHTQRTTSRHDTQHNLPRPTTSFLTPGQPSYNKPPGRLTLPPSRNIDSSKETNRFVAPTPVHKDEDPLPKPAPSKPASAKPYIPRQKITPLVTDSSTSRGSQIEKSKSTFGAHNGVSPKKKLIVAEEGHWQDGAWVEGEARQPVDDQPLFSGLSPEIAHAVLDSAVPVPIVHQANPHDDDLPSSPPPSPIRPSAARRLRLPRTPPANAQLAQALPAGNSQIDYEFSPIFSQPATSKKDAWIPTPSERSPTRRQRMISSRTDDEGMLAVATSSTRIDRSSSRPRGRRVSTSPLTDDDAHTHPALRKESLLPKPLSHPEPTSTKSRSASSAPKQPLTYGASKTNMIPAPLGAKKSRQMDAREERKAARRAKGDHLQQLGGADRRSEFSRYGDNAVSNARDSSYTQVRKSRTRTDVELPLSTSGVLASSRASSTRSIKPAYDLPVVDAFGADEGANNYQDDDGEERLGVDEESVLQQSNFERDNAFRAGVTLHETDIETFVDRPDRSRREPAKEKLWVRPKTKRSKSKKRRRGSPSYRYLDGGRPPTSQPICNPAVYRKRPRTFQNGLDDSDADERGERRRKRQRRHQWGDPHPEEASGTDEEKVDPRYQPLSKYGDPIERDREYQLEKHGLMVLGQGLEGMAAKAAHEWEKARERVDRAPPPPKLKMSRKRSANERVIKYVNVISEHSKSSRTIRPIPVRNATAKIRDLPGYVIKPLKTISWEEYNTAYNEERPCAINNQLVQRTMSGLRAKALKPGGGRNRLRTTRTGIRQDREIRRLESRGEEVDDVNERIDTLTPSFRPPIESVSRMGVRRVPKLVFTTRTPPPLLATPAKSQKRKVTSLLTSAEKEKEVGDDVGIVMEEEWGGDVRHDPIVPDFFDDAFQVEPISVQDPILAPRDQQPNENATSRVGGKTIYMSSTTGKLKPVNAATQITAKSHDTGAFSHENIGEEELRGIDSRVPNLDQEGRTVTTAGKSVLASRHPVPADDIFDDDDFPSVPSAVNRPSASTSRYKPPGPTVASSDTTSTSGMLSGVNMTDLMMEALKKTAALFDTPPATLPPPPTGGMKGPARLRRVRQPKMDETTKGKAKSKPKGKGRDPGERPNDPPTHESQLTLPSMLQHRPRATQLPSRTGEDMDEVPLPPASARVVVAPPVFAAVPPLAGMMGVGTAPRLGLQRTRTAGLMTPLRTSSPLLAGKSMNMLKSQFKPPTQGTPTQLSRSRPRAPLSQIDPRHYASSELDQGDSSTTPYNEPGQHCPSPTQTTVAGGRTPGQSRNRYASTARVSTTQRDSSAADLSDMTSGQQYDDEPDADHYPYAQKRPSLYNYQDPQYPTRPDPLSGRDRAIGPSRQIGPSSSISSGFAPVNPSALIRRTSFSKVMPKHSALKRSTKADYLPGGDGMGIGAPAQPGRSAGGAVQRRGREDRRGVGTEGQPGGLRMERIGSQRARQQFRAPTRRPIGGEEGEQGEGERR